MPVTARISIYRFDPDGPDAEAARAEKREIWTAAVEQEEGHLGELCLVTDDGRQIVIHLWESEEAASAASVANNPRLRALIKEQFEPDYDALWIAPPEHVMANVVTNTLGS
jgi:plasmid stability protein